MKRSRRVILTMMGTAAVGAASAVSMGFVPRGYCGPDFVAVPGPDGRLYCRPVYYGGFGGVPRGFHGHGGHAHGGG
jgi:hypothetical protein